MKISLFVPCYVDQCFPEAAIGVVRVLRHLGHEVEYPERQTCCGQPAFNSGYWPEAREVARNFLRVFAASDCVVAPSASCVSMVRVCYKELFAGEPEEEQATGIGDRVFEFTEFLVGKLGVTDIGARFPARVTVHESCHALRELKVHEQPRALLEAVRDIELVDLATPDVCCGFGGTFSVKYPEVSTAMGDAKIDDIVSTGAEYVVSTDTSCLMHIGGRMTKRGIAVKPLHIAELLAKGIAL